MGTVTIVLQSCDSRIPIQRKKSLSRHDQMFWLQEEAAVDGARALPRLLPVTATATGL